MGGGRYDKLLSTFGGEPLEAAGFGFGDAVIVELLKMKGLLPDFSTSSTETVLIGMQDESLRPMAMESAMAQMQYQMSAMMSMMPQMGNQ